MVKISGPNLSQYDWIICNSSAGKDSQTTLRVVAEMADRAGVLDRVVIAHADLGRIEWEGCKELAERQGQHYGISRFWSMARPQGDFLQLVRDRGKWPDSKNRLCTSSLKRDQIAKLLTELTTELALPKAKPARILSCLGMRAAESPPRAKLQPYRIDDRQTNGRRRVDQWLPIHDWSHEEVWSDIRSSGVPYHHAYDLGMKRLSCRFCIFADKASLLLAGRHAPELLAEYVKVEEETKHDFRYNFKIASVQAALLEGDNWGAPENFAM